MEDDRVGIISIDHIFFKISKPFSPFIATLSRGRRHHIFDIVEEQTRGRAGPSREAIASFELWFLSINILIISC